MRGITIIQRAGLTIAALLTFAAAVATAAQADPWQLERASQMSDAGDRDAAAGPIGGAVSDALDRYVGNNPQSIPDAVDRYLANDRVHSPQSIADAVGRFVYADHSDRIAGDSRFAVAAPTSEPGPGLDWDVFAFGFGLGIAACALPTAALLSLRRRRTLVQA